MFDYLRRSETVALELLNELIRQNDPAIVLQDEPVLAGSYEDVTTTNRPRIDAGCGCRTILNAHSGRT